jgi:hypothetical protein
LNQSNHTSRKSETVISQNNIKGDPAVVVSSSSQGLQTESRSLLQIGPGDNTKKRYTFFFSTVHEFILFLSFLLVKNKSIKKEEVKEREGSNQKKIRKRRKKGRNKA